jgi:hypothetical protein
MVRERQRHWRGFAGHDQPRNPVGLLDPQVGSRNAQLRGDRRDRESANPLARIAKFSRREPT